jgi:hypothetical protein
MVGHFKREGVEKTSGVYVGSQVTGEPGKTPEVYPRLFTRLSA